MTPVNIAKTNGILGCIAFCERSPDCQAFTYKADGVNGTGYPTSPGQCYLKKNVCAQGVGFQHMGQLDARYMAGIRPAPVSNSTATASSALATTANACAASPSPTISRNGNQYYIQCSIDTDGAILQVLGGQTDYTTCLPICDATATCIGFTFKPNTVANCPGYCYLKYTESGNNSVHFIPNNVDGKTLVSVLRLGPYQPDTNSTNSVSTSTSTTTNSSTSGAAPGSPTQVSTSSSVSISTRTSSSSFIFLLDCRVQHSTGPWLLLHQH